MSPLANGNLTAAELDNYMAAEAAYNAAKAAGETEDEAKDAARAAVKAKVEERGRRWVEGLGR